MADVFSMFDRPLPSVQSILKFSDIGPDVQAHLAKVYATLAIGILGTVAGTVFAIWTGMGGGWLAMLGLLGCVFYLATSQNAPARTRMGVFTLFTVLQGIALGDLVRVILFVDPSILMTAGLGALTTFACFSLFALVSARRSMLYLGGILSAALSWLMLASLINMFMRSSALWTLELYVGLAVFVAYVVFDTQVIVEKAAAGNKDVVMHAVDLYLDLISIFVRIAIILLRNREKERNSSNSRDRRSSR